MNKSKWKVQLRDANPPLIIEAETLECRSNGREAGPGAYGSFYFDHKPEGYYFYNTRVELKTIQQYQKKEKKWYSLGQHDGLEFRTVYTQETHRDLVAVFPKVYSIEKVEA